MSATAPTGWKTDFDTPSVTVPAGKTVNVVAHVTPSSDAIAGDYVTTFKATAPVANASADIRVTIQTSLLWGIVGVGLDRARADRPVVDLPAVRPPMSEAGAPNGRPVRPARRRRRPKRRRRSSRAGHPHAPADQEIRDADGGRPARPRGLPGRDLRAARPERRGQDDHDPDAARAVRADRRRGIGDGARPCLGAARGQAPGRLPARRRRLLREHDRASEPALHGPSQRPAQGRGGDRHRRGPRPGRPRRSRGRQGRDLLAGHAPAARHRRRPGQVARPPDPRRADDLDRPDRRRRDPRAAAPARQRAWPLDHALQPSPEPGPVRVRPDRDLRGGPPHRGRDGRRAGDAVR